MNRLVVLTGPTAIGKTDISINLAKKLNGEIISADSMQVYRRMNIGTAKITPGQMQGIPHHLIDILEPDEPFGVFDFRQLAKSCIDEIQARGHVPILVGGTGFYIQAVLYDIDFTEYDDETAASVHRELEEMLEKNGSLYMHEYLRKIDPESAGIIHMNNTKKMLHAIEYYKITGKRISKHNEEQHLKTSPYDFRYFVLTDTRENIYDRINTRVDLMMESGLENEVRKLLDEGLTPETQSMLGIGYKEMTDFITGKRTLDEAVEDIKRETRHFAKKQLTWFKREKDVEFINKGEFACEADIVEHLYNRTMNQDRII